MKLILPLNIKNTHSSFKFPLTFFQFGDTGYVKLDKFTIEERESLFGITDLKITGTSTQYKWGGPFLSPSLHKNSRLLLSEYKIVISDETDNPSDLQKIQVGLGLVLKILIGKDLSLAKIESDGDHNGSIIFSDSNWESKRNIENLDNMTLEKIQELLTIILDGSLPEKIETLSFFLDTALQAPNLDIAGAFYVTLLESLFVPKQSSEIGYRFSMRLSKMSNKDLQYQNKIKKMYNRRSEIFHGNRNKFNSDDVKFLEEESTWALKEYIKDPKLFEDVALDGKLLGE